MLTSAVLLLLASAPVPTRTVWIQPVGTTVFGLASLQPSLKELHLPIGGNIAPSEDSGWSLALEVTFLRAVRGSNDGFESFADQYWGWFGSAGVNIALSRDEPLRGLFVQPKLLAIYMGVQPGGRAPLATSESVAVGPALDVGYQWVWGSFYLAAVVGVGAHYCLNCDTFPLVGIPNGPTPTRSDGFRFSFNLNALRVGYAF